MYLVEAELLSRQSGRQKRLAAVAADQQASLERERPGGHAPVQKVGVLHRRRREAELAAGQALLVQLQPAKGFEGFCI